jgi:hypothetical protein
MHAKFGSVSFLRRWSGEIMITEQCWNDTEDDELLFLLTDPKEAYSSASNKRSTTGITEYRTFKRTSVITMVKKRCLLLWSSTQSTLRTHKIVRVHYVQPSENSTGSLIICNIQWAKMICATSYIVEIADILSLQSKSAHVV